MCACLEPQLRDDVRRSCPHRPSGPRRYWSASSSAITALRGLNSSGAFNSVLPRNGNLVPTNNLPPSWRSQSSDETGSRPTQWRSRVRPSRFRAGSHIGHRSHADHRPAAGLAPRSIVRRRSEPASPIPCTTMSVGSDFRNLQTSRKLPVIHAVLNQTWYLNALVRK